MWKENFPKTFDKYSINRYKDSSLSYVSGDSENFHGYVGNTIMYGVSNDY